MYNKKALTNPFKGALRLFLNQECIFLVQLIDNLPYTYYNVLKTHIGNDS